MVNSLQNKNHISRTAFALTSIFRKRFNITPLAITNSSQQENLIRECDTLTAQFKSHPQSLLLIVSAWNPAEIDQMALPLRHVLFQFYVQDGELSCQLYQRSCALFLVVPLNIASYSLPTTMMAQAVSL